MAVVNEFDTLGFLSEAPKSKYTVMEDFEYKKKTQTVFTAQFTNKKVDSVSYFVRDDEGTEYTVTMLNEEFGSDVGKGEKARPLIGRPCQVVVKEINYETNTIYVSNLLAKNITRDKLIRAILRGLATGRPVRTKARVAFIRRNAENKNGTFLELNVAGVGVKGYLLKDDWSTCYTSTLNGVAKVGDIIDVEVTDILAPKSYKVGDEDKVTAKNLIVRCSRKNTISFNPWEGVDKKFPVGSIVNITCTDKHSTSKFYARVDGLAEANALCVYPDTKDCFIRVGGRYLARVKKVVEKEKVLILKPFKEL